MALTGKQGCLAVFDGLVCTHWGGRQEVGAGTCQGFANRYAKRSVSPLIEGSNTLIECASSLFASMVLCASSTKPAASTSLRTDAGAIRCSDWASLVPAPTAAAWSTMT